MKPSEYRIAGKISEDRCLGYRCFVDRSHPLSSKKGKVYYHRHRASVKLGRWLTKDEHVHHKNKNRRDNRLRNLVVMTKEEHYALHGKLRTDAIPKIFCRLCRKRTRCRGKFCSVDCYRIASRKVKNRPSSQQLTTDLSYMSVCAVGRKYGVSDNAVRKWLRTHVR